MKKIWLFFLFGILLLVVCGKLVSCSEVEDANARAVLNDDVNEFVGIENSSMCEFGCELGYESSGYGFISREIYRFSSLDLGIRFTYEASRITEDGEVSPKMTIIHTGNLVCLRRDDELERKDKMWCIEFFPYEEREQIGEKWNKIAWVDDEIFATWNLVGYLQPNGNLLSPNETTKGIPYYDMSAIRHHLPDTDLYFVQYNCDGCAPWADFSRVNTMEIWGKIGEDTIKVMGTETPDSCPFGCTLGQNRHIGGRDWYRQEISRFTSPNLGITLLYPSALWYTDSQGIQKLDTTKKMIHEGNRLCLSEEWCIEFFPYEQREKWVYEDDQTWIKKHLTWTNLYFVEYHCVACAPWPDFSRVNTMEPLSNFH